MGAPFGNTAWTSDGIWGNKTNVIGSGFTSQRDPSGVRASDEATATAPSGSAQLSHQSEAEPWAPRGGIWNSQDNTTPGRSTSGSTSPSHTRDGNLQDSQYFQTRSVVGPNGNAFTNRTKPAASLDPSSTSFKYPVYGNGINDEVENIAPYSTLPSKYPFDNSASSFKRGSQEPFANLGQSRENTMISTSRASEISAQAAASLHPEVSQYSFDNSRGSVSRPSAAHHTVSFPSNGGQGRGMSAGHTVIDREISGLLADSLRLNDSPETYSVGLGSNTYSNGTSQPFQTNHSPPTWNNESVGSGRGSGHGYPQHEAYSDQVTGPYLGSKRGSVERNSPNSAGFHRSSLNSPRFANTPNPRAESWSGSRPISRNHPTQEFERQQIASQFPQGAAFFPNNQYFGNGFNSQYPPSHNPYELYGQGSGFRNPMQMSAYAMGLNQFMPSNIPIRPSRDQDPGKGMRSVLLEEFRASNRSNKRYELKDIYNHIVEFSGDQHGSRFIQEKLQSANSDEKDQVFKEIQPNALQLMKDVFGNYVIQKFFEHGNQVQKKIIAAQMKGKIAELSTQMYACRVVQKALEHVLVEQQEEIVAELKPDLMRIVKDQNGNHVIQKIISMVPRMCVPDMMVTFKGQISTLAAHNYGCRVIQRMLEQGTEIEKQELMTEIHTCAHQLIMDQYGNYVAQHIVSHGSKEDRSRVIQLVIDDLLTFSKHKFASNVVEKCIEFGTKDERMAIKNKLTSQLSDGTSPLHHLMKDQYGNYVIQKVVGILDGDDKADFVEQMKPQFASLKKTATGRQIMAIDRIMTQSNELNGSPIATPLTPSLQLDVNSAAPTPALTTEHNSPESCSPPSTSLSAAEDTICDNGKTASMPSINGQPRVVEADEAER